MSGPAQSDKTRALTNIGSEKIGGLALKTCEKVPIGISLEDGRKKSISQSPSQFDPRAPRLRNRMHLVVLVVQGVLVVLVELVKVTKIC